MKLKTVFLYVLALHCIHGLISSSLVHAIGCPVGCICNERLVRCMRLQLTNIPDIPAGTNILDLRYNFISEIPTKIFQGLSHLHTIFLNENQVTTVNSGAFLGLPSLKYLYLDKNRISNISADAFQELNHLDSLYLQYNNISGFFPETFFNLPHLRKLCCTYEPVQKKLNNKNVAMNYSMAAFQEPRGVMRILQFIFAIVAFATTTNFSVSVHFTCNGQTANSSVKTIEYPFRFNELGCVKDGAQKFITADLSSDACGISYEFPLYLTDQIT